MSLAHPGDTPYYHIGITGLHVHRICTHTFDCLRVCLKRNNSERKYLSDIVALDLFRLAHFNKSTYLPRLHKPRTQDKEDLQILVTTYRSAVQGLCLIVQENWQVLGNAKGHNFYKIGYFLRGTKSLKNLQVRARR